MKEAVQKDEIMKLNRYGTIYTILLIVTMVSAVPLFMWLGTIAFVPWGIVFATSLYFALKIEIIKKNNELRASLYEDLKDGIISKEDYENAKLSVLDYNRPLSAVDRYTALKLE